MTRTMHLHFGTGLVEGIVVSSCLFGWIHFSLIPLYLAFNWNYVAVCSAVGVLPLSLQYGFDVVEKYGSFYSLSISWNVLFIGSNARLSCESIRHKFVDVLILTIRRQERNWCLFCSFLFFWGFFSDRFLLSIVFSFYFERTILCL